MVIPAEVRFYRNRSRTLNHPPMYPQPDVRVCVDCGWSEFSIPRSWLTAGWLQEGHGEAAPSAAAIAAANMIAATP